MNTFTDFKIVDMPMEEYHAHPAYNNSKINVALDRSIKHMLADSVEPTEAMAFGSAFHELLLEPEKFKYTLLPSGDKRTKEYKESMANLTIVGHALTDNDLRTLDDMLGSLRSNVKLSQVLDAKTWVERAIFATHIETGLRVKIRPDFYTEKYKGIGIDVKTTADASPQKFKGSIYNFRYYRSYALYYDILKEASQALGFPFNDYRLLAVEKTAPYGFSAWVMNDFLLIKGREEYTKGLKRISLYEKTGIIDGYLNDDGSFTFECL